RAAQRAGPCLNWRALYLARRPYSGPRVANIGTAHADAVRAARAALHNPDSLPSARVLAAVEKDHGNSFIGFVRAQSEQTRATLLGLPFPAAQQAEFEQMTAESLQEQKRIEAADTMPFEIYREQYVSPARLGVSRGRMAVAA
ncbi:glutamate--cysteine ligase, partial [Variovorax sp. Varisp62]